MIIQGKKISQCTMKIFVFVGFVLGEMAKCLFPLVPAVAQRLLPAEFFTLVNRGTKLNRKINMYN